MIDLSNIGWRKSTYSASGDGCVEIAFVNDGVAVRDSKSVSREVNGPVLMFTSHEWQAFIDGVRSGEFDLP